MFTPPLSARHQVSTRPQARLATFDLAVPARVVALGALLVLTACDGMEIGSVPQCSVLQPNCSSFGPAPESSAPVTATSSSPANATATRPPSAASGSDAAATGQ
jgi:hypothetical protein